MRATQEDRYSHRHHHPVYNMRKLLKPALCFARLVGLAQHPDGSLLVADDTNSVLYRVSHGGQ